MGVSLPEDGLSRRIPWLHSIGLDDQAGVGADREQVFVYYGITAAESAPSTWRTSIIILNFGGRAIRKYLLFLADTFQFPNKPCSCCQAELTTAKRGCCA